MKAYEKMFRWVAKLLVGQPSAYMKVYHFLREVSFDCERSGRRFTMVEVSRRSGISRGQLYLAVDWLTEHGAISREFDPEKRRFGPVSFPTECLTGSALAGASSMPKRADHRTKSAPPAGHSAPAPPICLKTSDVDVTSALALSENAGTTDGTPLAAPSPPAPPVERVAELVQRASLPDRRGRLARTELFLAGLDPRGAPFPETAERPPQRPAEASPAPRPIDQAGPQPYTQGSPRRGHAQRSIAARVKAFADRGTAGAAELAVEIARVVGDDKPLTINCWSSQLTVILGRPMGCEEIAAILLKSRDPSIAHRDRFISAALARKSREGPRPSH